MPTNVVQPTIPSDMWQTLIRIETATARSETKIDGLADKIDGAVKRLDQHEDRISRLESMFGKLEGERGQQVAKFDSYCEKVDGLEVWQHELSGGAKGVSMAASTTKVVLGALLGILAYLGGDRIIHPPKAASVAKQEVSIEKTVTRPVS